ncbi:MAG TPA: hypothetical protein VMF69_00125, partial [Gemmataceae bacterium]|nr:hypothetical protein [Gemmataceae bacterium]
MFSLQRLVKFGYVLVLGSAVFVLCWPAPVRAQRTIAYAFIPGIMATTMSMAMLNSSAATPMISYNRAQQMLMQAGVPAGMSVGGGTGMSGGGMGMSGGGMMGMSGGGM